MHKPAIAIHGGAGAIHRSNISAELEQQYIAALKNALQVGYSILQKGGSALDAVESAVINMEDCPLFNAGKGSVYNSEGKHEMDASIMWGKDISAGAVALIRNVKNPVALARAVMEKSEHVFFCGDAAEEFARKMNLPIEPDDYFNSAYRYEQWQKIKQAETAFLDHNVQVAGDANAVTDDKKFGTVGAVALDINGNLAAATSTGGMTNKKYGRVGDSPVIGASTYANNNTCAVSCTGHGEMFIRAVAAYDVSCLMEYKGLTLAQACREVVMKKLVAINGEGGLIAIDNAGNIELVFNSEGMFRAMKNEEMEVAAVFK